MTVYINHDQGCIAALLFMLKNAAKFDVDDYTLLQEIQQLGRVVGIHPLAFGCSHNQIDRFAKRECRGHIEAISGHERRTSVEFTSQQLQGT